MGPAWRIIQPYNVALAPQINSPEPLWYVGCKVMSGEDKICESVFSLVVPAGATKDWKLTIHSSLADLLRSQLCRSLEMDKIDSQCSHGVLCHLWPEQLLRKRSWARLHLGRHTVRARRQSPQSIRYSVLRVARRQQCVVRAVARRLLFVEVLWQLQCIRQDTDSCYTSIRICEYIMVPCMRRRVNVDKYLAISPYNKEHYFVAFRDRSIQYNFTGAPSEWMRLMKEVFDAWTAERTQPQQPLTPPSTAPYAQMQPYQQQPASYCYSNSTAGSPYSPATPLAPPTPVTPNTPLSGHAGPNLPNSQRNSMYAHKQSPAYVQPPIAAIELPVELPGDTLLAPPAPPSVKSVPSEVSCSPLL